MPVIEAVETYFKSAVKYGPKAHWVKKRETEYFFNAKNLLQN